MVYNPIFENLHFMNLISNTIVQEIFEKSYDFLLNKIYFRPMQNVDIKGHFADNKCCYESNLLKCNEFSLNFKPETLNQKLLFFYNFTIISQHWYFLFLNVQ